MAEYTFVPGAVAASTATAVPADFPQFLDYIEGVVVQTGAAGGTASTTSPAKATVVYTVPGGGLGATDFYYDPVARKWQYGTATTTGTTLILHYVVKGQRTKVA